ncbi:MAG TPA: nitroreductase [Armatimonadota bacterium]|jgi:nitroreductase
MFDASENGFEGLCRAIARRRSFGLPRLDPDRPVDPSLVRRLLEAADWAPSHKETEPWRFTVFAGGSRRALGEAFAEAYRLETAEAGFKPAVLDAFRNRPMEAPVWISIGMSPALRPDGTPARPEEEEVIAVGCAVQNLHLAACAAGLGGRWSSKSTLRHPTVARFVGLPPFGRLLGFFFLGWPVGEWPAGKRRPLEGKVTWAPDPTEAP